MGTCGRHVQRADIRVQHRHDAQHPAAAGRARAGTRIKASASACSLWLMDYRQVVAHQELELSNMRGGNKNEATREHENRM